MSLSKEREQQHFWVSSSMNIEIGMNICVIIITTSISRILGLLYKIKKLVPFYMLVMLYNSLIFSYITYFNVVWATSTKTKINSIYLLQKKTLRICTGSPYLSHTSPIFYKLKTLTVFDINLLQSLQIMFKYSNNILPLSF